MKLTFDLQNDNEVKNYKNAGFNINFSYYIWNKKYRAKNEKNVKDTWHRVSKALSLNNKELEKKLYFVLDDFKATFAGRIIANVGRKDIKNATLMNCYGSMAIAGDDVDSIDGIYKELKFAAKTLASEGGWGVNLSFLRPKGTIVRGTGIVSPGIVKFAELFDKSAEVIVSDYNTNIYQGEKRKNESRKGAQMLVLEIWHNDIEEFISAKQIAGRLTHFNISVGIRNDFMNILKEDEDFLYLEYRNKTGKIKTVKHEGKFADNWNNKKRISKEDYKKLRNMFPKIDGYKLFDVRKGGVWKLKYPDISVKEYKKQWNGDIYSWQYEKELPIYIYKIVKAKDIWNKIMKATYNRNEPGLMFLDNMDIDNNLYILGEKITGTNPCGEIPVIGRINNKNDVIYGGDNCNLGSINLAKIIKKNDDKYEFDFDLFKEVISTMIEGLDNVIDITSYPHKYYETAAKMRRKVGLGIMGLGSLFYILNIRYGSKQAVELWEKILKTLVNIAYQTSAKIASKKGTFKLYDKKILKSGFIKRAIDNSIFTKETIDLIKKYGLRNSQLLAIAPTGSTAIYMDVVSGGHEPVFNKEYVRWYSIFKNETKFNEKLPDTTKGEWFETKSFYKSKEGDEEILLSVCGNYKIEKTRGIVAKEIIRDYGYKFILNNNIKVDDDVLVGAQDLSLKEHLAIHSIAAKYIDQSVSKTINLKKDFAFEDFEKLFYDFWKIGGKGLTTYRDGTMTKVLETIEDAKNKSIKLSKTELEKVFEKYDNKIIPRDLKIPHELPSKMIKMVAENKKWYFHIIYVNNDLTKPFAIFIQTNHKESAKYRDALIFELLELAKPLMKNQYGQYLFNIANKDKIR
jgi:ribonucleoside-diphosphate reductase alpha chain